jgi:hypothetical protein
MPTYSLQKGRGQACPLVSGGREIPSVLRGLRKISQIENQIENQISVRSMTLQHQVGAAYVNEDIFRHGKLTAKGGDSIPSRGS